LAVNQLVLGESRLESVRGTFGLFGELRLLTSWFADFHHVTTILVHFNKL